MSFIIPPCKTRRRQKSFFLICYLNVTSRSVEICCLHYLILLLEGLVSYLRYLCLFAYSGVQRILCCVLSSCVYPVPYVSSFSGLSIFDSPIRYFVTCILKHAQNFTLFQLSCAASDIIFNLLNADSIWLKQKNQNVCVIHFTILIFKTGVIIILVLADIEHPMNFSRTEKKPLIVLFLLIAILFDLLDIGNVEI